SAGAAWFIRTARALAADVREIKSHRLSIPEWAQMMREMITRYITVSDPHEEEALNRYHDSLDEVVRMGIRGHPAGYEVAHALTGDVIAEIQLRSSTFTGRGVAVGSLTALRSMPFRAVFVLGLGEALFPERDRQDPLDVRLLRRQSGDITPRERDRYLFLEAILAARESIVFSYVERDPQTGDSLEPSTTIRELLFILRSCLSEGAVKKLTVSHPISRYDRAYFPDIAAAAG